MVAFSSMTIGPDGGVEDDPGHDVCVWRDGDAFAADECDGWWCVVDLFHVLCDDLEIELEGCYRGSVSSPMGRAMRCLPDDLDGFHVWVIAHEHVSYAGGCEEDGDHVAGVFFDEDLSECELLDGSYGQWAAGVDEEDLLVAFRARSFWWCVDGDRGELCGELGHVRRDDDPDGFEIEGDGEPLCGRQCACADGEGWAEVIERRE